MTSRCVVENIEIPIRCELRFIDFEVSIRLRGVLYFAVMYLRMAVILAFRGRSTEVDRNVEPALEKMHLFIYNLSSRVLRLVFGW